MSLENTLERIAQALEAVANNLAARDRAPAQEQVQASAATTKPRAEKKKPTPAETPAPAVTPEPQDANPAPAAEIPAATSASNVIEPPAGFTLDDVRKVCRELATHSDRDGIMEVFGFFSIQTLEALKPEQFAQAVQMFAAKVAAAKARAAAVTADDLPF